MGRLALDVEGYTNFKGACDASPIGEGIHSDLHEVWKVMNGHQQRIVAGKARARRDAADGVHPLFEESEIYFGLK